MAIRGSSVQGLKRGGARSGGTPLSRSLSPVSTNNASEVVFPDDLESLDHWCTIRIFKHELMRQRDTSTESDIARIFLPMPAALSTGYSHGYNAESLGPVGALAAKAGAAAAENERNGGGALKAIASVADAVFSNIDLKGSVAAAGYYLTQAAESGAGVGLAAKFGAVGGVLGAGIAPAAKGALAGAGIARNPFMALLYDSPAMREHSFSWKLISRSYEESQSIFDIIKLLKYHAAPSRTNFGDIAGQSVFLQYPDQFDVDFYQDGFLFNMAPSVLKNISVNYHPDGPMYHVGNNGDKAPVAVQIDLSFQEVAIITKENINSYKR